MRATKILLGMVFLLMAGCVAYAQSGFTGNAEIHLEFSPSSPTMGDGGFDVRVVADLNAVRSGTGAAPVLTSFSVPVGFDPSFVRLISVEAGEASGYSADGLAYTEPSLANGRGFVTLINSRSGDEDPGTEVELGRLAFEIVRPGNASFIAGSARTVHQGALAAVPKDTGTPVQRVAWADRIYQLRIAAEGELPSLLCSSWFSVPDMYQGMALLNEGAETASIRMFGWGPDGTLVDAGSGANPSAPISLAGHNQNASLADQIFESEGSMNVEDGWIEIKADKPEVAGFFLQGVNTSAGTRKMDGVQLTYNPASNLIFPLVRDPNRTTGISIVNPGSTPVTVNMRVVDSEGFVLRSFPGQIPSHGTFVREITDATDEQPVYVEVQAAGGKVVGVERIGAEESLAVLSGQDAALASNRLSGPQFASGFLERTLRIDTHLALVNPSLSSTTVILRLLNETGQELAAPVVRTLGGGSLLSIEGWKLFGLPDPATTSTLKAGTVSVESDQPIIGALSFGDPVSGGYLAALPLMSTSTARREVHFGQVAVGRLDKIDYFTGLALVNPSATDGANISIALHAMDGTILAQTTEPYYLGPGNRTANLVQQLIPGFPATQFGGYIRLTSDVEVYAYMLIGDNYYNFLSAVP